ncbi:hypothetical protein IT411_01150 [Candidatus Peregrinibacteria bacterium]|nr:hypothetical protein [Candidatus Peregrinibacteria bacterium]
MKKFGQFITCCGCLAGAFSFFAFVIFPGILYTFFPQYGDAVEAGLERFMTAIHAQEIINAVGPFLMLFLIVGVPLIAFSPLWLGFISDHRKISRLKMVGVGGSAKITSVEDTGITVNNSPYARITLENLQTHTLFQITTTVSRIDFPGIGDKVEIIYDPADPTIALPASRVKKS